MPSFDDMSNICELSERNFVPIRNYCNDTLVDLNLNLESLPFTDEFKHHRAKMDIKRVQRLAPGKLYSSKFQYLFDQTRRSNLQRDEYY
jgi:hypothetical protein